MSTESVEISTSQPQTTIPSADVIDPIETEVLDESSLETPESKPEMTKAEQKAIKEYLLKVNGKEIKTQIDLNDDERIKKALQLEAASQEAFQRAAAKDKELLQMNNQLDQFFKLLQENPLSILMNPELGLNAEEIANKILDKRIEEEMKSPEQKEIEKRDAELAAARAKLEKYEQAQKEAEARAEALKMEKLAAEIETEIETSINKAIEKGDLPESPYVIAKFAQLMDVAIEQGIDIKAEELIPIVKTAYVRDMKHMVNKLSDVEIEDLVTPDRVKSIRNKRIQAVKEANAKIKNPKIEDTGVARVESKNSNKSKDPNFWKKFGTF